MNTMKMLVVVIAAAVALTGCMAPTANAPANGANVANANTNANANMAKTAEAPTAAALLTMDKNAYEAFKTKNASFWDGFLAANFVGYGASGRLDRAAAMKEYAGTECDVKSYTLSDEQMTPLGADAAIISYKAAVDGTCAGQKIPPETWAASLYVREGDKWKGAFHAETPVVDPNAPPAKMSGAKPQSPPTLASPAGSPGAGSDSMTEPMMAIEKQGWEAWKNRDVNAVQAVMAKDFTYLSGTGRKPKAEAIKGWSEPKCEGLAYTLSNPKSTSFTKDVALITYDANVKGTCDGKPVPPNLWVGSFDVKEGDQWKNAFYMDSPK
jgi:ketosteroid isomerase-like protein